MSDPRITDEMAAAARRVYWEQQAACTDGLSAMRAALEAALPPVDLYRVRAEIEAAVRDAVDDLQVTGVVESGPGPDHSTLETLIGHVTGFALAAVKPHLAPRPVVDREALIKAFEASASRGETVFGREFVEGWADTFADAVLALLNGGSA